MKNICVSDVIRICGGKLVCGEEKLVLGRFCTDSRKVLAGDVYVGIRGEKVDGNDYYQEALSKGAECLILEKEIGADSLEQTVIVVPDTLKCLQELARYKRSLYDIPVIAITGSAGKTSTKDMIYSVVSKKYKTHKTSGNYNNHLGVPLTILGLTDEEALVIELGMNHLGEISLLSEIVRPTMAIITNVGTAHIGNLGNRENILKAKLEILEGLVGDTVIINNDNDLLFEAGLRLEDKYNLISVAIDGDGNYKAVNLEEEVFSSTFDIFNKTLDVVVNVGGKVYIYNALMAFAVGECLGIDVEEIKKGILDFKLTENRLEKKVNKRGTIIIDDTYNANYDAMKSSLELLGRVKDKRKIAILGDMLELGEYTFELHTDIGEVIVDNKIDILVTVGTYSKYMADRALELGFNPDNVFGFDKEEESYEFLEALLTENDVVLVKGSHGVGLVRVVNKIMEF